MTNAEKINKILKLKRGDLVKVNGTKRHFLMYEPLMGVFVVEQALPGRSRFPTLHAVDDIDFVPEPVVEIPKAKPGVIYRNTLTGLRRIGLVDGRLGTTITAGIQGSLPRNFDPCVWSEVK